MSGTDRARRLPAACGVALLACSLFAFGGPTCLLRFERMDPHRFTAMAMLTGSMQLRHGLAGLANDEEVFNGATYTHWSYGIPLLQLPFHAIARLVHPSAPFFPDRAIFFLFLAGMVVAVWVASLRLFEAWMPSVDPARRTLLCASATWLLLACTAYPACSCRFDVYEETVAYLVVFELYALAAYVFTLLGGGARSAAGLGLAAGMGMLIRPTGVIYAGAWALSLALQRNAKKAAAFAATLAPLAAAWLFFNWVRTGSVLHLGFANSNPGRDFHQQMQRFGSPCVDTTGHLLEVAARLFEGIFFYASPDPSGWMKACHFDFAQRGAAHEPLFGPVAPLVLVGIAWSFARHLARRERRLAVYVPYGAVLLLFASYVQAGAGFSWRYMEDFYPLLALAAVELVRSSPPPGRTWLFGGACLAIASVYFVRYVEPWKLPSSKVEVLTPEEQASLWPRFRRQRWGVDPPRPSRLACPDPAAAVPLDRATGEPMALAYEPYQQRQGWSARCAVGTFTNVYLGVPREHGDDYTLRFETAGMATPDALRLYFNGAMTTARRIGDAYEARVHLCAADLTTPTVMATLEWTPGIAPPAGRLLSVELE